MIGNPIGAFSRLRCRLGCAIAAGTLLLIGASLAPSVAYANGQPGCVGDCNGCQSVEINELVTGVNILLERLPLDRCPSFDANDSNTVEINELVQAVSNLLVGCPAGGDTPTPTPTPTLPAPTETPNLEGPARAVAGGATVVANVMNVVPSIVAAIANGLEFGGAAGADLGGGGHAACPQGGSATRTGTFPLPPNLTIMLSACRVETTDGFVTYDGMVSLNGGNFTVDITARFDDQQAAEQVTAVAMIMGTLAGIPGLGDECEITRLSLRVTSGSISTTRAGEPVAQMSFMGTTVTVENILFVVPGCVPVAYRLIFNGPGLLLAGDGEPVEVAFNQLRVEVDERPDPAMFNISGAMASPCFGGPASFSTAPLLAVPDDEVCPVDGTIAATFMEGMSRVSYRADQSVDIDRDGDGTVDETVPNCLDARLLMCAA